MSARKKFALVWTGDLKESDQNRLLGDIVQLCNWAPFDLYLTWDVVPPNFLALIDEVLRGSDIEVRRIPVDNPTWRADATIRYRMDDGLMPVSYSPNDCTFTRDLRQQKRESRPLLRTPDRDAGGIAKPIIERPAPAWVNPMNHPEPNPYRSPFFVWSTAMKSTLDRLCGRNTDE